MTGLHEQGGEHAAHRTLTVGPGDVHQVHPVLRVSRPRKQAANVFKAEFDTEPLQAVQVVEAFAV